MNETKYIKIFRSEIEEHIHSIGESLKALLDDPKNHSALIAVMKKLHSMKGISSAMGYSFLADLSHLTEDLVASYKSRNTAIDDSALKVIYEVLDIVEKFKQKLPEEDNDLIKYGLDKVQKALEGKPDVGASSDREPYEQAANSVNEILNSIDSNVKISVGMIESLIGDIGELKHNESALRNLNEKIGSYKLKSIIKKIESQLKRLSNSLIQIKMQPFDTIAGQLERAINEYCLLTGKKINFSVNTNNIVIDSSVLKLLVSPLIHLIRNAIDHGIETSDERKKMNKPAKGTVSLTVKRSHDFAEITIEDDGRGIPIDLIVKNAVEKGYIDRVPESIDNKLCLFILTRPGFTTRDEVSAISGRGLGLDIVKSSLETIGGGVSLDTSPGKGTSIVLKVPVTTSVIRSLLLKAGDETVAVPSSNIEKLLQVKSESITDRDGGLTFEYDGKALEVKHLSCLISGSSSNGASDQYSVILMNYRDKLTAILADELVSEEDLFIHPLTMPLKRITSILGYSVLGDGAPVFLFDINNL